MNPLSLWLDRRFEAALNPRRQRAIFYSLLINNLGVAGIVFIPLLGQGQSHFSWATYAAAVGVTVGLQAATMLAVLWGLNERLTDSGMGRFGVVSTLFCASLCMLVSPTLSALLAPMFACCYAWGIFRFKANEFIRYGLLAVTLFLLSTWASRWWHGLPGRWTGADVVAAASLVLVLCYIGILGSWAQRIRHAHRTLNRQLLALDPIRVPASHTERQMDPASFLQRLRDENTLVGIGKPTYCVALIRMTQGAEIASRHGPVTRSALVQHVSALAWVTYGSPDAISELPDGSIVLLLTHTPAHPAREASGELTHRLNGSTVVLPGAFEPIVLHTRITVTEYRNGESPHRLIERARSAADDAGKPRHGSSRFMGTLG